MQLILTRHTQTNYNVKKLCNADPTIDVHLTKLGIIQAKKLAKELQGYKFDFIYVSQLPRTKQTAVYINKYHCVPLIEDKRINDNITGFEGKPVAEFLKAFEESKDKWNSRFNGGETLIEVWQRVEDFINDLKNTSYQSVLIVTHGFISECFYRILNNLSFEETTKYMLEHGDFEEFII